MQHIPDQLALLQHGDSFFPSGNVSFSYGLETLYEDGRIETVQEVSSFLDGQLRERWATFDRGALVAAHKAAPDPEAVGRVDVLLDASTLATELRQGSCRNGRALLKVHTALGTPGAAGYTAMVTADLVPGHVAAVQGLVWNGVGLGIAAAELLSAHTFVVGILGAALRLGMLGHIGAQGILNDMRLLISELLQEPPPELDELQSSTFEAEIAIMRHETAATRLFSN